MQTERLKAHFKVGDNFWELKAKIGNFSFRSQDI